MYINKETGDKISTEDMQKYADENGVSVEEHAANFGYTLEGQPEDFPASTVEDADAVQQPMTASQAGYVEPEDTESSSVVGLSDSRIEDIEKNFKVGYYHPEQREAYKNWEETGEVDGALLPDFDVDDYKKTERVINDDFRKEVESIYQESAKGVKLDKFGSFDYDDKESIANFRDRAINKLIKENKTIQNKILPQATSQAKFEFDSVNDKLKEKYGINSKNVSQENIDNYTKEATAQFNALVNSKVNSTPEFKQIITDFNSVMDETGRVSLDAFTRGKDWEGLMSLERGLQASNNPISQLVFKFIQQTYAGGKQIKDGLDEAGVYGAIQMNERFISQLDDFKAKETNKIKNKYLEEGYTEEQANLGANEDIKSQKGWWRESKDDLANAFKFVKITSENQIIPSGVTKGSFQDYENSVNKKTEAEDLSIRERLIDVADQQLATSAYGTDEFKNFMKGDNMLENSVSMVGKQLLPQMGIAILTAGVGNAIQMGSGMYVDGINNKIREKYGLADGEEITQDMLKNVISDEKFVDALVTKSVAGGFLAGQLERLGAGKLLSNLTNKGAASILRTGLKRYAQRVGGQVIRNFTGGATEAITEVLQEVLSAGVSGNELDREQLFEAGGTGFLVSAMTGLGGNVVTQTIQEVKTLNRMVAGKLNPESAEAFFNTKSSEIDNLLKTETNPSKIQELKEKKQSILDARNANLKIPSNFSTVTKEKIFSLVEEKQSIEKEIKNKDPELVRDQTDRIKEINTELNRISDVEKKTNKALKAGKKVISDFVQTDVEGANKILEAEGKAPLDADSDGFFKDDGSFVLVMDRISDKGVFNTAAHEILHKVLYNTIVSVDEKGNKQGAEVVKGLSDALKSELNKMDPSIIKNKNFKARLELYKSETESVQAEEVLTLFADALAYGEISYSDSLGTKLKDVIRRVLQNLGIREVEFNTGKDVYNFIKDYNRGIKKGKLGSAIVRSSKEGVKVGKDIKRSKDDFDFGNKKSKQLTSEQDTQLRSDVAEIKKEASEGEALAKRFGKDFVKGAKQTRLENKVLQEIKPIVDRVVTNRTKALYDPIAEDAKKNVSRQMFQESMRSDIESMVFDEFTGKQDLEKFIVNRAFLRANNLAERLGIKNVKEGITKGLEAAEKVAVEETSAPKADRPKYRNILKSNVLPTETVNTIKDKVLRTVRTLKSKLDTKVSKNKTVTPLIAEIKKNMGKQADIDFKKAMGGKKDAQLRRFLIKNKKAVLENMTTTWLMGAMPGAVQKQVNGSFTSDWQGKKIDREKTSTQQAGRTSGAEIVRRLPNAFKNLDDKTYLSYIIDESGAPIRGRKESLAKAMAEELSFDIFTTELQNEDSDIRKALEGNQEALGVVLADNFVQQVSRDAERGTVKFSKTAINLNINQQMADALVSDTFRDMLVANIKISKRGGRPFYSTIIEYFNEFPIEEIKTKTILKKIAGELSSNYTSPIFGEIGIERIVDVEGLEKTIDYLLTASEESLTQGDSYSTIQLLLESEDINLDEKTLEGLNAGRAATKKIIDKLVEKGFTGNEIKNIFTAIYSPSGLGGFKGKLNPDGKTRSIPKSSVLTEDDLGIKYEKVNKKTGRLDRQSYGSFMINVADFEQNFLKGIEMGPKVSTRTDAFTKNFYTDSSRPYNKKLNNQSRKDFLQELQNDKEKYVKDLLTYIEAVRESGISPAAVRTFIRAPFASMDGLGKIASTPRWMPAKLDGTLLSFKELVKIFGRTDGKVDKGVFEHTKPANRVALSAFRYALTGKKSDLNVLKLELEDFDTAFITEKMDADLRRNKLQSLMGLNYVRGEGVMNTRYLEMVQKMNEAGITFYDAKTNELLSPVGVFGKELNQEMEAGLKPIKTDQKAINNGTSLKFSKSPKKIRVFDFDDTLARTKSNVLYTMPDGSKGKIDAATFAKDANKMEAEGAVFDFSEFSKVMNGKEGPLLDVAKIIAEKRGTKDVFVLTARPQDAAGPIQEFLSSMGLNIPLENITGLADGDPKAKANWMVGKVAEGYNDFYFADDHLGNVKAVKDVFNTFDVKGKVQQAKVKFSKGLDKGFNDMIERQTGTESFKEFSKGVAQRRGKKVGKFKIFVSPSAEDFRGLTQYKFAGKGKQGEADQKFFEEALMDPYFKGVAAVEAARETIKNDTKALFKIFKPVKKKLNKLVPGIDFTYDGAVRVYLWNKAGIEIPGLTKRDNKKLNDTIANDPELSAFADALLLVSKQDTWPAPTEYWEAKTTLSDLNNLTEKTNRKQFLTEFIENVDIIFSEKNLNKVEALYGKASRVAIENAIFAMKTGSNSPNQSGDGITNSWLKWVNNSIGTIMFFNRRSALLQLTSTTNFLNWSDNNPAKAALAFANQPQYWKDWAMIFNSDKLKQRRSGLKSDVQESEIANAAKNTEDKIGSIIAYLLKIGFSPTQIADSIAISSGGATFYRNRVNSLKKKGMSVAEAEAKAFEDFSKLSDEAQQSGDPALVSQQQRSVAGRLILSFQNTTMQYTRLMKKAGQDLINRRGDDKTNVSKILYYGALQNLIFNALSQTAFALIPGFDEDEDEDEAKRDEKLEEKASRVLNGMTDSIIRGTGIYGAVVTTIKNTFNTWKREADKGFVGDQAKTILEAANISPAIGSKLRKIYSAIQAYQFDKAIMEKHPWSVTIDGKFNPSATYSVIGSLASATLNLPLDRALAEARGVAEMFDNRNSEMQRIALALGWRTWNVGAKNEEFDLIKMEAKAKKKEDKKEERAKVKKEKDAFYKKIGKTMNDSERTKYFSIKGKAKRRQYLDKIAKQKGIK